MNTHRVSLLPAFHHPHLSYFAQLHASYFVLVRTRTWITFNFWISTISISLKHTYPIDWIVDWTHPFPVPHADFPSSSPPRFAPHTSAPLTPRQIDPGRTAALGASYGGYMVNWIQGHNDLFGFSALVCHDGIFDTTDAFYTTEEVWFPHQDFGGSPVEERGTYER